MDMASEPGYSYHCRYHLQPQTEQELEHAISAVQVCCCAAVRYAGNDKTIIDRIGYPEACDALPTSDGLSFLPHPAQ